MVRKNFITECKTSKFATMSTNVFSYVIAGSRLIITINSILQFKVAKLLQSVRPDNFHD